MTTMPDFGGFMPTVLLLLSVVISVTLFLLFYFWIMPPISRKMIKAKWNRCSPGFIQDDAGRVHFVINDTELPSGVIHNKAGWFLKPRSPYIEEETQEGGRGRRKQALSKQQTETLETILEVPVLQGLGKGVFFGYDGSPIVSNLKTLTLSGNKKVKVKDKEEKDKNKVVEWITGHADLRLFKSIIPATISLGQLRDLHKWSVEKGYKKAGGDTMKFVILIVGMIALVACVGIVAYLLLNAGGGGGA